MKATKKRLIDGETVALALGAWSVQAAEKGSARGAAQDLIAPIKSLGPKTHIQEPVLIGCPMCKADWLGRAGRSPKRAVKPPSAGTGRCIVCGMDLDLMPTGKPAKNIPAPRCAACPPKK